MNKIVTPEKWEKVNPENKQLLKEFVLTLKQENRSKSTQETYIGNAKRFMIWILDNAENKCITELKKKDFRNYSIELQSNPKLSTATHNHYVSAIKSWCDRLEDDDDIEYEVNACRKIKGIKIERVREIIFLTDDQVTKLYNELIRTKKYQLALYLALSYDSTGRRAEVMQVRKESFADPLISHTNPVIKKGGKKEVLVYFERTKEAAALYLAQRGDDDNPSLWTDFGARPRAISSANSWCETMSHILTSLEGKKIRFTPHCLRHSAIENLSEGTHYKCPTKRIAYDIKAVSKLASHASVDMTEKYKKDKGMQSVEDAFNML